MSEKLCAPKFLTSRIAEIACIGALDTLYASLLDSNLKPKRKELQLWHDRNDDRSEIIPHLLFPGDAPFWGGAKRRGIVVACSGIQPWLDKLVSGMVADLIVAIAYNAWMQNT